MLVIVVVNQSIMGRPPLQYKLSTRPSQFRPYLRQSPLGLWLRCDSRPISKGVTSKTKAQL
jgi:hypothetical protein